MERRSQWARRAALVFRPKTCCLVAPLRAGLLALGYFNLGISVLLIVGTASSTFVPMCVRVQEAIVEEPSVSTCILGPTAELALSVLLLAAAHRRDVWLLRVYTWASLATLVGSVLVYCLVVALIGALYLIAIAASLVYQSYVLLLVRSLIVEIRFKGSIDKSTLCYDKSLDRVSRDIEAPPPAELEPPTSTIIPETPQTPDTTQTTVNSPETVTEPETVQVVSNLPPENKSIADASQTTTVNVHNKVDSEDKTVTKPSVGAINSLKNYSEVIKVNNEADTRVGPITASEDTKTEENSRGEDPADVTESVPLPQKKKRRLFRKATKDNSNDGQV